MPRLDEADFWVDDLYDMTEAELQNEADHYARLARHGPAAENKAYRFAFHRHQAATQLLAALRKDKSKQ